LKPRALSERALLVLLAAVTATGPAALSIYMPVVPLARDAFGVSVAAASTTVTAPLVAFAIGLFVYLRRGNADKAVHFYTLCLASFILSCFHYTSKLNNFDKVIYWGNVIAGVGVANVMYVVVKERTHDIGVKMALGARKSYIHAQIVFEALFLSFLGGGAGTLISVAVIGAVRLIPASGPMQFLGRPVLSPAIMLITGGILGAIGLLAGFFPARRAASVDPVESLRYE